MARKGISPVVAVVILIAIAVMIGGLVSSWMSSFVSENTDQDMCAINTLYSITDITVNDSNGEIKLRLKNTGKLAVYNFSIEAENGTTFEIIPATSPAANYSIGPGETQYVIANTTGYNITNIDTLTVISGSCSGYAPKHTKIINL